jgi:LuxR family quorum sensing-dependent transcriptional regulator
MEQFAFAYSIIERIERAKATALVLNEVAHAARHFGLEHFIIAGIPAPGRDVAPYVLMHNWPHGWYDRYITGDYVQVDPVVRKLRTTTSPVIWSEAPYDPAVDKSAHAVMTEARELSLNDGLAIPLHTPSGDQAVVSFGGGNFQRGDADHKALHLVALYAYSKAATLRTNGAAAKAGKNPRLSPRETEIVQWVAAGLSSSDISERLHISYNTVETHVANACRKLDSACRTQAVAEAIRAGLIS